MSSTSTFSLEEESVCWTLLVPAAGRNGYPVLWSLGPFVSPGGEGGGGGGGNSNPVLVRQSQWKVQDARGRPCRVVRFIGFPQRHLLNSPAAQTKRLKTHAESPSHAERSSWQSRGVNQIKFGIWDLVASQGVNTRLSVENSSRLPINSKGKPEID